MVDDSASGRSLEMIGLERDEAGFATLRDFFEAHSEELDPARVEWLYRNGPTDRLYVDIARTRSGEIAAMYAVLPVPFLLHGVPRLGAQSLDTITTEEHRGQGLFVSLAQRNYARLANDGVDLVYGFPNASSARGFFTKLGWTSLDPVPFLARPLRTSAFTSRLGAPWNRLPGFKVPVRRREANPHLSLSTITRFGPEHEQLWRSFAGTRGVAVDRNAAYLNWRLIDKAPGEYILTQVHERDRLVGFAAHCLRDKHDTSLGYLMECIHIPDRSDVGALLVSHALGNLADEGAELVLAWCLPHSPNYRTLRRGGFLPLPERLRPIELHVGARDLRPPDDTSDLPATITSRGNWYLSYCDSDTV